MDFKFVIYGRHNVVCPGARKNYDNDLQFGRVEKKVVKEI